MTLPAYRRYPRDLREEESSGVHSPFNLYCLSEDRIRVKFRIGVLAYCDQNVIDGGVESIVSRPTCLAPSSLLARQLRELRQVTAGRPIDCS